jgi:hypothetical protein
LSTLGLKGDDEQSGYEVALFFGRTLRAPWQPIRLDRRFSIRELVGIAFRGESQWVAEQYQGIFTAEEKRSLERHEVVSEFIHAAAWDLVQGKKPRLIRIHDWVHDRFSSEVFRREAVLWYGAIAREFRLWRFHEFREFQESENLALERRMKEIDEARRELSHRIEMIKAELGYQEGDWADDDPRWTRIEPLHQESDALSDEWGAVFDRRERRERALDRQFAKVTEREAPSVSLVTDWVRWRGYDLSANDIRRRLLPAI